MTLDELRQVLADRRRLLDERRQDLAERRRRLVERGRLAAAGTRVFIENLRRGSSEDAGSDAASEADAKDAGEAAEGDT
jgi:hypothetical protein